MKRRKTLLLAGLASVGGAVGAGLAHNRRRERRERLYVTVFCEPGYLGRNKRLAWNGGERELVPLTEVELPRVGSIRLERLVYRFRPGIRLPSMYFLRHAVAGRLGRTDPEDAVITGAIAMNQLAGMFSMGEWERVPTGEARSGVRLWARRPGSAPPVPGEGGAEPSGKAGSGEATSGEQASAETASGEAAAGEPAAPDARPWHDVLADTPDLGSWSTRTRYLELGHHDGSGSQG
ncbi:hypothetical protein [Streptomyces sp. NPDC020917]|uniref:hypothetical protein n=1 Tax=Streptomyces sp. NPDC020917 TaxID=3365102 RepID=UPI0037B64AD3